MTTTADTVPLDVRVRRGVVDELLLLVLAGIPTGALVAGLGSRLAMLILRLTSHPRVNGIQSDDDFTIGRFTLGGTYNLMVIGAAAGIIGAAAYQWVRPWLIGPRWFRYLTVGLASGAVVGSMLVHADGIDFRALTPTWLAIGAVRRLAVAVRDRDRDRGRPPRPTRTRSRATGGRAGSRRSCAWHCSRRRCSSSSFRRWC